MNHHQPRAGSARPGSFHLFPIAGLVLGLLGLQLAPSGWAAVTYSYDDGTAERAIGIDPGEDSLWFNRFAVAPGGEVITSISAAFGRPGITVALNGLPIKVLLYEDIDGGSPWNAVLKRSVDGVVSNANTNTLNVFNIPPTEVHGTLLAAMLLRNRTTENKFIAALDQTAPTVSDASFYAFTVGDMDETNLGSVPAGQFGTIESLGFAGNWLIRANGTAVPEPTSLALLVVASGAILMRSRSRHSVCR